MQRIWLQYCNFHTLDCKPIQDIDRILAFFSNTALQFWAEFWNCSSRSNPLLPSDFLQCNSQASLFMTWMIQLSAPSASGQMIQNADVGLVTPDSWAAFQRDLGGLEQWANRNRRMSSKGKCKLLPLGRNNPGQDRLEANWLESSSAEKALRFLVDPKLTVSQQRALTAKAAKRTALDRGLPACRGRWACPSAPHWWDIWSTVAGAGLPVQGRQGLPGASPMKGRKDDKRTGVPDMEVGGWEDRDCSAWRREG